MSQPVQIYDNGRTSTVTDRGELIVSSISHSKTYTQSNSSATTSTVVPSKAGKQFVITAMLITHDKNNTDVTVSIFEASDDSEATQDTLIITLDMGKNEKFAATGLDIITDPVKWINLTTDGAPTISATISGYYVDE